MSISFDTLALAKKYTDEHGGDGGGTSDYSKLTNKPSINGVTLEGNKTTEGLKIHQEVVEVDVSSATPGVPFDISEELSKKLLAENPPIVRLSLSLYLSCFIDNGDTRVYTGIFAESDEVVQCIGLSVTGLQAVYQFFVGGLLPQVSQDDKDKTMKVVNGKWELTKVPELFVVTLNSDNKLSSSTDEIYDAYMSGKIPILYTGFTNGSFPSIFHLVLIERVPSKDGSMVTDVIFSNTSTVSSYDGSMSSISSATLTFVGKDVANTSRVLTQLLPNPEYGVDEGKILSVVDGKWQATENNSNVQPDWNQSASSSPDYIKNKPMFLDWKTIEWDGAIGDNYKVEIPESGGKFFYKISESTPTFYEIENTFMVNEQKVERPEFQRGSNMVGINISGYYFMCVYEDNLDIGGITINEKGIYVMAPASPVTIKFAQYSYDVSYAPVSSISIPVWNINSDLQLLNEGDKIDITVFVGGASNFQNKIGNSMIINGEYYSEGYDGVYFMATADYGANDVRVFSIKPIITGDKVELKVISKKNGCLVPYANPSSDEGKILKVVGGVPTWALPE